MKKHRKTTECEMIGSAFLLDNCKLLFISDYFETIYLYKIFDNCYNNAIDQPLVVYL